MTNSSHSASQPREDYTTSEGLRALLHRLHRSGSHAWKHDHVAAELAAFAAEKYAALARKHGLDPWEAASAAFDVMRTRSAREAIVSNISGCVSIYTCIINTAAAISRTLGIEFNVV